MSEFELERKPRLDQIIRSRGLRIKLMLSFMLLVFITTFIMFMITYTSTRDLAAAKIRHRITLLASVFSKDIDNEISSSCERIERLTGFRMIKDLDSTSQPPGDFAEEYLKSIEAEDVFFLHRDEYGFECINRECKEAESFRLNPDISRAVDKKTTVAFSTHSSSASRDTIYLASPIINNSGKVETVLIVKKRLNTMQFGRIIEQIEEGGPGIQAFLTDSKGTIIANPNPRFVGMNVFDPSLPLFELKKTDRTSINSLKKEFSFGKGKNKFLGASTIVNRDLGWRVIIVQPYSEVFQAVRLVSFRILFVGALALVVAFGLAMYRAHRITAPIGELLDSVSEIARGDYSKRVKVYRMDEVGSLAHAFNRMSATLEEKINALQQSQEQLRETFHQLQLDAKKREQANIDLRKKIKELTSLSEVTQRISDTLELNEILDTIVNTITDRDTMGFEICSIKLLDKKTNSLRIKVSRNLPDEYTGRPPTHVGKGISGLAAQSQSSIIIENLTDDPRVPQNHVLLNFGVKSMCCIPLVSKKSVVGVLNIYSIDSHIFSEDEMRMLTILANQAASAIENAQLFEDIRENYFNTIEALSMTIDAKDTFTHGHSKRVSKISEKIGIQMKLDSEQLEMIKHAGDLHDIGKIGISESIIGKEGKLSVEEYETIKTHPLIGATIIEPVPFLKDVKKIIRHHHERHDGYGYPDGLKDKEIPLLARILHIADAYDAMISDRPYRKALSNEMAIKEIRKHSGTQFDPEVVEAFIAVYEREKDSDNLFMPKSF